MVTIEQKDQVLAFICKHCLLESVNPVKKADAIKTFGTDAASILAILNQMMRMGLLEDVSHNGFNFYFVVRAEAHDYYRHGGFKAQEELLTKNIQKLILELEQLKPDMPERAGLIAGIAGNIAAALGLFL